ncbi:MAG: TfoX/Sxy family DNA transformation protein [Planctomycetota bacterium]
MDKLRNLGERSAGFLKSVGIETVEQLRDVGPVFAFATVKRKHPRATLNLLWSIAGGLDDRDWRSLDASEKESLLKELDELLR